MPGRGARIDVTFEPGRTLDGWTCELLDAATHVAALVLEFERASGRPPQFARIRRDGAAPIVGSSRAMRDVRERIERLAATPFTILIEGESGTGKELVARQLHDLSRPAQGAVRRGQLRRDRRNAARSGAVRDRGSHGDRRARPPRQVRARARGHAVPRRGVGPLAGGAGEAAARDPGPRRSSASAAPAPSRVDIRIIVATNRPLAALVRAGPVPARSVLPAGRRRDPGAAVAGAARRHRGAGALLPPAASRRAAAAALGGGVRRADGVSLAGQRARAGARHRTRRRARRVRPHRAGRPAAGAARRLCRRPAPLAAAPARR